MATIPDDIDISEASDQAVADELNARRKAMEGMPRTEDSAAEHYANLIDEFSPQDQQTLADIHVEAVGNDLTSRAEWEIKEAEGLRALGIGPNSVTTGQKYDAMTDAAYPIILQACLQFQSRLMKEIWPPQKPVKFQRVSKRNPPEDVQDQRERVEAHFNYQVQHEDTGGREHDRRMAMYLAFRGTAFKYLSRSRTKDTVISEFVPGKDIILPYKTACLEDVDRFTQRLELGYREIKEMIEAGELAADFMDELPDEGDALSPDTGDQVIQEAQDEQQGVQPDDLPDRLDETARWEFYRCYVFLDTSLHGFDDPEVDGSDVPAPYVLLIHVANQRLAAVYRDWAPGDRLRARDLRHVKYGLVPNPWGFYDLGYLHLLGNLDSAATAILSSIADAGLRVANSGGFFSGRKNQKAVTVNSVAGVFESVDVPTGDFAKSFFIPDWKPPSPVLAQTIGMLTEAARGVGSATEAVTGEAGASGPVGTMLALIEQGLEVLAEIFASVHDAKRREYAIRARLNRRFLPQTGHVFTPPGEEEIQVDPKDYDGLPLLVPVSDPQASSPQLRVAKAEASLQLAERLPGLHDQYLVAKRMYQALQVEDFDEFLIDPSEQISADQVTEIMALVAGKPVKVEESQDHDAHRAVIAAFLQSAEAAQIPEPQLMAIQAHDIEHLVMGWRMKIQTLMQQAMGPEFRLPPVEMGERRVEDILPEGTYDPEMEAEVTRLAAQAAGIHAQQNPPPPTPEEESENEEARRKQELHDQALEHRDQEHKQKLAQDQQAFEQDLKQKREEERAKGRAIVEEGLGGPRK